MAEIELRFTERTEPVSKDTVRTIRILQQRKTFIQTNEEGHANVGWGAWHDVPFVES